MNFNIIRQTILTLLFFKKCKRTILNVFDSSLNTNQEHMQIRSHCDCLEWEQRTIYITNNWWYAKNTTSLNITTLSSYSIRGSNWMSTEFSYRSFQNFKHDAMLVSFSLTISSENPVCNPFFSAYLDILSTNIRALSYRY